MNAALCILLLSIISSANCRRVVIDNSWIHGFDGHINFTPKTNLNGWRIHVKFSQPISYLKVWSFAHIVSQSPDKKEFVLQYDKYFKHLRAGQNVKIGFTAHTPSKTTPTAAFHITEGNSNAVTTTTTRTTTLSTLINNQCMDVSYINCKDVHVCKDSKLKLFCPVTCGLCGQRPNTTTTVSKTATTTTGTVGNASSTTTTVGEAATTTATVSKAANTTTATVSKAEAATTVSTAATPTTRWILIPGK